jgi:hypothetical protein
MMKKNQWGVLICIFFMVVFFQNNCKTAEETQEFTLTVSLGTGVSGTPVAGTTTYSENDTVNYNYSAEENYGNLTVTLDGAAVASSGTITMTGNHTLNVKANVDIRALWVGHMYGWYSHTCTFGVTFSGGITSGDTKGSFSGNYGSGHGTYTVNENQIDFTLLYTYNATLTCTGTFYDKDHMGGTYRYVDPGCHMDESGTWEMERK